MCFGLIMISRYTIIDQKIIDISSIPVAEYFRPRRTGDGIRTPFFAKA